jgi:hypothetical protein
MRGAHRAASQQVSSASLAIRAIRAIGAIGAIGAVASLVGPSMAAAADVRATAPSATPSSSGASAPKPAHSTAVATYQRGAAIVEQATRELDALRDDAKKTNETLKAANALISRGKRRVLEGELLEKAGRALKKRGKDGAGDAKILAGQRAIDEGAREVASGVEKVKAAQAALNTLEDRKAKVQASLDEGRKLVREGERGM